MPKQNSVKHITSVITEHFRKLNQQVDIFVNSENVEVHYAGAGALDRVISSLIESGYIKQNYKPLIQGESPKIRVLLPLEYILEVTPKPTAIARDSSSMTAGNSVVATMENKGVSAGTPAESVMRDAKDSKTDAGVSAKEIFINDDRVRNHNPLQDFFAQRKTTKYLPGIESLTYDQWLGRLFEKLNGIWNEGVNCFKYQVVVKDFIEGRKGPYFFHFLYNEAGKKEARLRGMPRRTLHIPEEELTRRKYHDDFGVLFRIIGQWRSHNSPLEAKTGELVLFLQAVSEAHLIAMADEIQAKADAKADDGNFYFFDAKKDNMIKLSAVEALAKLKEIGHSVSEANPSQFALAPAALTSAPSSAAGWNTTREVKADNAVLTETAMSGLVGLVTAPTPPVVQKIKSPSVGASANNNNAAAGVAASLIKSPTPSS